MPTFPLRVVANGTVVGTVSFDGEKLELTGAAESVFAELVKLLGAEVLGSNLLSDGWSNGYLYLSREAEAQ
ncbi:MAG TPA: hypothetical protein VFU40_07075 [Gemmatimonadales bacterium]|nr:hypothetical protein [Gemmatimonadales bacterium]